MDQMSIATRRLMRLGYKLTLELVEEAGRAAYAVTITRNAFKWRHVIDVEWCNENDGDRLPREMTRLAQMMEHYSPVYGDRPLWTPADEPPRDCPDGPLEATLTIDGEDRKTVYFFGAPPADCPSNDAKPEPERRT